ncbi:MAG TPA: hypothetical protein VK846_13430 [Candidatus Limnocylindria bacterium]|nr:hypothetical protein [Candidatus Limnocylindria bacterium]
MPSQFIARSYSPTRRLNRRLNHYTTTMLGGARRRLPTNHLAAALVAFRRAIRAHRRLMKLAPHRFDHGVMNHAAAEQEETEKRMASFKAALIKVYGDEARPCVEKHFAPAPPPRLNACTERAIAEEFDNWELWLRIGNESLSQFKRHHQGARVTLSSLCRLMETASTLGRLSTGLETNFQPVEPLPDGTLSFEAALAKIYGTPEESCTIAATTAGAKMVQ